MPRGPRLDAAGALQAALGWIATRVCDVPTAMVFEATGEMAVSVLRLVQRGRATIAEKGLDVESIARKCL
jgi:hypothetical protein